MVCFLCRYGAAVLAGLLAAGVDGTIRPKVLILPAIRDDSVFSVIPSRSKSVFAMIEVQIGIEIEDNLQIFWEI